MVRRRPASRGNALQDRSHEDDGAMAAWSQRWCYVSAKNFPNADSFHCSPWRLVRFWPYQQSWNGMVTTIGRNVYVEDLRTEGSRWPIYRRSVLQPVIFTGRWHGGSSREVRHKASSRTISDALAFITSRFYGRLRTRWNRRRQTNSKYYLSLLLIKTDLLPLHDTAKWLFRY